MKKLAFVLVIETNHRETDAAALVLEDLLISAAEADLIKDIKFCSIKPVETQFPNNPFPKQ